MHWVSSRRRSIFLLGTGALALGASLAACGGSSSSGATPGGPNNDATTGGNGNADASDAPTSTMVTSDDGPGAGDDSSDAGTGSEVTSMVSTMPGSCANPTVKIDFSPMYSAFIPGSTAHTFQIPAVTDDGNPATWSVSDPTQTQLVQQAFGGLPGVMITVQGAGTGTTGQITVIATESDGTCGSSTLNITSTTEDDWQIGNARYNDGVSLGRTGPGGGFDGGPRPDGGGGGGGPGDGGSGPGDGGGLRASDAGSFYERDGGTACTNCHGPTATTGPYRDVSHTPEQTGGFSDSDLIQIVTQGNIPDGGYFDPNVIITTCDGGPICTTQAYTVWHGFHQWSDITSDQYTGIVTYLRSIQPEQQNGSAANFGGRRGDGGAGRRDGGGAGLRDAAGD